MEPDVVYYYNDYKRNNGGLIVSESWEALG